MEKDKLFTIIYADILIFANFCQFSPMLILPKIEKAGCHLGNIGQKEDAPPPPPRIPFVIR